MRRHLLVFALSPFLIWGCSGPDGRGAPSPSHRQANPSPPLGIHVDVPHDYTQEDMEYLETLVEEVRLARGRNLQYLERSGALDAGALLHARDMAARGYFAHESPEDTSPSDRVGIAAPLAIVGDVRENLFFLETNMMAPARFRARSAHEGLMNSPTHRENILNDMSTHIGVAVMRSVENGITREYTVQLFGREFGAWSSGAPPREWPASSGARSLPLSLIHPGTEFYVVDHDHPGRRYVRDAATYLVGGFIPRLGPNDRTLQLPALQPGTYSLNARLQGEDAYAPTTWVFRVN